MEFLLKIFFRVIIIYIFSIPGAGIRCLFTKRTFKDVLNDRPYLNASISFIFIGIAIATWQFVL
jgi:uncharacterized protein YneF (UPF0154 family)